MTPLSEAAAAVGVSARTLLNWIKAGRLAAKLDRPPGAPKAVYFVDAEKARALVGKAKRGRALRPRRKGGKS